jgi:DSHCT (NUC185) domain
MIESLICSKKTDIYEGSLIRAFRLLVEVLRQMVQAAKAIGNTELENKFAAAITAIKRDIVFAPSLVYILSLFGLISSIYELELGCINSMHSYEFYSPDIPI